MRSFKRIASGVSSAVLVLSSLMTLGFTGVAHATAQTCTWTGTSGDGKFSTASNWANCNSSTPQVGDIVSFSTLGSDATLTDDLGVALGGVVVRTDGSGSMRYTVDTLTLATGATIDASQAASGGSGYTNFGVTNLTAQGALTVNDPHYSFSTSNATINGVLTLVDGTSWRGDQVGTSGVVVQNGASLNFTVTSSASMTTPTYPITLGGGAATNAPEIVFGPYNTAPTTWTFANPITLASNAYIYLEMGDVTVNQTGSITGSGFTLSLDPDSYTGSKLVLAPSSNTSDTVAGTYIGTGSGKGEGAGSSGSNDPSGPGTPDTGFAYVSSHPAAILGVTAIAAGIIVAIARSKRTVAPARAKATRR